MFQKLTSHTLIYYNGEYSFEGVHAYVSVIIIKFNSLLNIYLLLALLGNC